MVGLSAIGALAVAAGAVVGAWFRWLFAMLLNQPGAPIPAGTLAANLIGGLLVGMAMAWFEAHPSAHPAWRLFAVTGFLGALTTFSTFSAESLALVQRGAWLAAFGHSAAHLLGCLLAAALGFRLLR